MDIYTTAVLTDTVQSLLVPASPLLDLFFPDEQTEESEEIHFDVDLALPKLAPFVSPTRAGLVMTSEGYRTDSFSPAYVKPKHVLKPNEPLKRAMGEAIGGALNPMERRMAVLRQKLEYHLGLITRREELMASEVLRTGKITVTGEGYPTVVVDFNRAAALTIALTGGNRWGEVGVSIVDNLEDWAALIQTNSSAVARTVVSDPLAWRFARKDAGVKDLLDLRRVQQGPVMTGPLAFAQDEKLRYVGNVGDFEWFVYSDGYVDEAGAAQNMMPDYTVIMGSRQQLNGVRAYGAVQDEESGYRAQRVFSKSWLEKDPANRLVMTQSAPLVVPKRPNASLTATVWAP